MWNPDDAGDDLTADDYPDDFRRFGSNGWRLVQAALGTIQPPTPLCHFVGHILPMRPKKEMIGIDAGRHVAAVTYR